MAPKKNVISQLNGYKSKTKQIYRPYIDQVIQLYKDSKISKATADLISRKLSGRAPDSGLKKLQSVEQNETMKGRELAKIKLQYEAIEIKKQEIQKEIKKQEKVKEQYQVIKKQESVLRQAKRDINKIKSDVDNTDIKKIMKKIITEVVIKKDRNIIISKAKEAEDSISLKTYHITADIEIELEYEFKNKSGKISISKPSELLTGKNRKDYKTIRDYTLEIFASSPSEALSEYKERCREFLDLENYESNSKVFGIENIEIFNVNSGHKTTPKDIKMKDASPLLYYDIDSDNSLLKVENRCVQDQFVARYSKDIPTLTNERFLKLCYQVIKPSDEINKKTSLLDVGIDHYIPKKEWSIEDGVSPNMLYEICKILNISHYAYDYKHECFLKYVSTSRNYDPLVYYAKNSHMYYISDKKEIKSLIEKSKPIETKLSTSCLSDEIFEKQNIFNTREILENIEIKDIMKYDACTIIYSMPELNEILYQIIEQYNYIPRLYNHQQNIIKMHFNFQKKDIYLVADPNSVSDNLTWKDMKLKCEILKLEFDNQSFGQLITQLKTRFFDKTVKRIKYTTEEREIIFNKSKNNKKQVLCGICELEIKNKCFEIDHIIPLANGGTNSFENLQILHKGCHQDKTKSEQTEIGYIKLSETESSYNSITNTIINSDLCKSLAFVEKVLDPEHYSQTIYHIDINKCRKNIMLFQEHDYPIFTVMDSPTVYNGQSNPGYYYIESNNTFPLRGFGWYLYPTVQYCLEQNIIQSSDIKYTIQSSLSIAKDHYNEFINYLYSVLGDQSKLSVNSMIGCFKPKIRENWKSVIFTTKADEAQHALTINLEDALKKFINHQGAVITTREINDKKYYQVYNKFLTIREESESPIYEQIIECEAIELHKLSNIIKEIGGQILDLNTDCVSCCFKNNKCPFTKIDNTMNINNYFFDKQKLIPKYKFELKEHRLSTERLAKFKRLIKYEHNEINWKIISDVSDNNFQPLIDQIIGKETDQLPFFNESDYNECIQSVNIDARAGCGKTTLLKMIQEQLTNRGIKFVALAPTNKAARLLNGQTIHKFASTYKTRKSINDMKIKYIILDEISMLHEQFYKYLIILHRIKPSIKFIISGDFQQLLPVKDRVEGCDYKNSGALLELCGGNRIELTTCRRSNNSLFNICKNIKTIKKTDFDNKFTDKHLCFTNIKRKQLNELMMDKMIKTHHKKAITEFEKLKYDDNSQKTRLITGTPIKARKTNEELDIMNNEMFTVFKIDKKTEIITIKAIDEKLILIPFNQFQILFYIGYAITCHSAQGQTFDHPYSIHEWDQFCPRLKYVALSRATSSEFINII